MIQHHSDASPTPGLQRPDPPSSLLAAVRTMYAGAVVCAAHAVVYPVTAGATRTAIHDKHPHLSVGHLTTLEHAGVAVGAVVALLGALLFIWIARACKSGRNGARVTGTVIFGIAVLGIVLELATPQAAVNLAFALAECLTGMVVVILLWQRRSSAYFSYFKRPQF